MMRLPEAGGVPVLIDNIRESDEDNPNGYNELEPVKQVSRDSSWVVNAYGKAAKIVCRLLKVYTNYFSWSNRVFLSCKKKW